VNHCESSSTVSRGFFLVNALKTYLEACISVTFEARENLSSKKGSILPKLDPRSGALAEPLIAQATDRRSEARYPAQAPAELEILPLSTGPLYGTVLDVSRSGLRIALTRRLDRNQKVRVTLSGNVIFGEVRYCRAVSAGFQAGIRIENLVREAGAGDRHIAEDPLSLYAVGKGLALHEVIEMREHLGRCEACRTRLAEKQALLNPARKSRSYLLPRKSD